MMLRKFLLINFILSIEFIYCNSQLMFTSLTMPHKENPPASSSLHSLYNSPSMFHYYPHYHLAMNDSDSIPDEQRLMAQLLRNYDPSARPVYNASNTVSVAFGIALTQLSDMVRFIFDTNYHSTNQLEHSGTYDNRIVDKRRKFK